MKITLWGPQIFYLRDLILYNAEIKINPGCW